MHQPPPIETSTDALSGLNPIPLVLVPRECERWGLRGTYSSPMSGSACTWWNDERYLQCNGVADAAGRSA